MNRKIRTLLSVTMVLIMIAMPAAATINKVGINTSKFGSSWSNISGEIPLGGTYIDENIPGGITYSGYDTETDSAILVTEVYTYNMRPDSTVCIVENCTLETNGAVKLTMTDFYSSGTVTRSLDKNVLNRDGSDKITVMLDLTGTGADFRFASITETFPSGLRVGFSEAMLAKVNVIKEGTNKIVITYFGNEAHPVITYYLDAPIDSAIPGVYDLSGEFKDADKGEGIITGASNFVVFGEYWTTWDENHNGRLEKREVLSAVTSYFITDMTRDQILEVINAYFYN